MCVSPQVDCEEEERIILSLAISRNGVRLCLKVTVAIFFCRSPPPLPFLWLITITAIHCVPHSRFNTYCTQASTYSVQEDQRRSSSYISSSTFFSFSLPCLAWQFSCPVVVDISSLLLQLPLIRKVLLVELRTNERTNDRTGSSEKILLILHPP